MRKVGIGIFREALPFVEKVKKKRDKGGSISFQECVVSVTIGIDITEYGIETERLTNRELMAAIFVVNFIVKFEPTAETVAQAIARKDALQRVLIERNGIIIQNNRRYPRTLEVVVHVWVTHIPLRLLKEWGMRHRY